MTSAKPSHMGLIARQALRLTLREGTRDRFILIVTLFLTLGAVVALISGAIALRTDAAKG